MMMNELYELFIKEGRSHWAPRTIVYYQKNVSYFMQYLELLHGLPLNQVSLHALSRDVLVEYVVWLRAKERYAGHPLRHRMNVNGTIKSNTVITYMRAVKAFFNWMYVSGHTQIRYTEGLKLPRSDDDQIVPLLSSEVYAIDSIFDVDIPNDLRNLCILHLMLDAGLRSCEVINLEPGDIIFASNTIVINRSKGEKSRVVIMCPSLASRFRDYFQEFNPSGTLFRKTNENKAINEDVLRSLFLRIIRVTGVSRIHPHLLRHTFATSYIMGGGNLEKLRILMGHSDYDTTRKYLHLAAQNQILGSDIYRLDPVFFKSSY